MSKSDDRIKWFSFYPLQFSQDENVILMTNEQVGIYIRLLCHEWAEGSIPSDIGDLAGIVHTSPENMGALWPRISRCFVAGADPGRLLNPRLEAEREVALGRSRGSRKGGVAAAQRRGGNSAAPIPVQAELDTSWDREKAFGELWEAYPAKARVKRPLSEQYFVEKVLTAADFAEALTAVRPGGKWAVSEKWVKGFVINLPEFLNQECWREEPEPAGGSAKETGGTSYSKWEPPA